MTEHPHQRAGMSSVDEMPDEHLWSLGWTTDAPGDAAVR